MWISGRSCTEIKITHIKKLMWISGRSCTGIKRIHIIIIHDYVFFLNAFLCLFSSKFILDPLQMNMKNIQM